MAMIITPSSPKKTYVPPSRSLTFSLPLSSHHLSTLFQQLATMTKANIPLLESIQTLSAHPTTPRLKPILTDVYTSMQRGHSLYEAFKPHEKKVGATTLSLLSLGEATGDLITAFETLATITATHHAHKEKLSKALHAPLLTLGGMTLGMMILLSMVIPQFEALFSRQGATLPPMTLFLLAVSHFLSQWGAVLFTLILSSLFALMIASKTSPHIAMTKDKVILSLPFIGSVIHKGVIAHFLTLLSHLVSSGLSFDKSLSIATQGVSNLSIKNALETIQTSLAKGENLLKSFESSSLFDPIALSFISAAHASGSLDDLLTPLATYATNLFERHAQTLLKWIEPFLILCMGGMVLILALGIFMPMWSLSHTLGH